MHEICVADGASAGRFSGCRQGGGRAAALQRFSAGRSRRQAMQILSAPFPCLDQFDGFQYRRCGVLLENPFPGPLEESCRSSIRTSWTRNRFRRRKNSARRRRSSRWRNTAKLYAAAKADPEAYWAEQAKLIEWFGAPNEDAGVEPAAREMVRGREAECFVQLPGPASGEKREQAGVDVGGGGRVDDCNSRMRSCTNECASLRTCFKALGVKAGDCVAIYMPMIPEVARWRCWHVRASGRCIRWSSAGSARRRWRIGSRTAKAKILMTADGGFRRGKMVPLKETADAALKNCPTIQKSIVVQAHQTEGGVEGRARPVVARPGRKRREGMHRRSRSMRSIRSTFCTPAARRENRRACCTPRRDIWCNACGARGWCFDMKDDDVYWCTADIGWVTGHSYVVYGPLANGATHRDV